MNRRRVGFAATSGSGSGTAPAATGIAGDALTFASVLSRPSALTFLILALDIPSFLSPPSFTNYRGVSVSVIIDKEGDSTFKVAA